MTDVVSDPDCDGTDLAAYQTCVESFDLVMISWQALVFALAIAAVVVGIRAMHKRSQKISRVLPASVILLCIQLLGWVLGIMGVWAPDRPLPYDPSRPGQEA